MPEFRKAPLKYSDGAVDGGHYCYALYLLVGIIFSLFASHRTSLVRHRSHAGRQPAWKTSSEEKVECASEEDEQRQVPRLQSTVKV